VKKNNLINLSLSVIIGLVIALLIHTFYSYLTYPDFFDHAEPQMAIGAMLVRDGLPLYTAVDDANRYSLLYGPATYVLQVPFISVFENPILGSKVYGIAMYLLGLVLFMITVYRLFPSMVGLLMVPYYILLSLIYNQTAFWNRPDSAMLMAVSGVLFALSLPFSWLQIGLCGLFLAILINTKIHAIAYVVPLFVWFMYVKKASVKRIAACIALALVLTLAAFAGLSSLSIGQYLFWATASLKHGFQPEVLLRYINDYCFFFAPFIALVIVLKRYKDKDWQKVYGMFATVLVGITLISLKKGAGAWYFMPFAPLVAYFTGDCLTDALERYSETINRYAIKGCLGLMVLACVVGLIQKDSIIRCLNHYKHDANNPNIEHQINELNAIKKEYKGYTFWLASEDPFISPLLYSKNHPLILSAPAILDMNQAGISIPEATYKKIENEAVDIFLTNKGALPFDVGTGYDVSVPIYSKRFQKLVLEHYVKVERFQYFDVWISHKKVAKNIDTD